MSQELMSAKYYRNPSEDEVHPEAEKISRSPNPLLAARVFLNVVFWVAVIGGGGFMACRAAYVANQPKSYAGNGGNVALNMLSFCMNLIDVDWDKRVDDRIRSNTPPDPPSYEIPDIPVDEVYIPSFERPSVPSN